MAKKGLKMVEIFWEASHLINNNIFNIFCFSTFSLGYFLDLVFGAIFLKFIQNARLVKYPREKVEKQKMLKMLLLIICEPPQKNFNHFLAIFGHFYPISLEKVAVEQNSPCQHFRDPQILVPLGK